MSTTGATAALAAKVLAKPLLDIYEYGKEHFQTELEKLRNSAMRQKLVTKIVQVQKVKTFWQRDREISLSSFYFPSKITFPFSGISKKTADSLAAFPSTGNFVIQGTVGQGKSMFLRHLCAQELRENGSGRIPIFVELRSVTATGIKSMVFNAFDRLGFSINDRLFTFYASTGKIVLLLDAFDELDDKFVSDAVTELETFSEKFPKLQIFITSRRHSTIQGSRLFRVVHLAPLDQNDHEPFLRRLGVGGKELSNLIGAIKSSPARINGLLTTPLMLTLLVIVYRAESVIPQELPEFYEKIFETLFSKHDHSKPGYIRRHHSGLGERQLQSLFQAFCFSCIQHKYTTRLTTNAFHECFNKALQHLGIKCNPEGFSHDITQVTCLMQEEGFDRVFIHRSVVEFFAASFVRSRNDETAKRFYEQVIDKNWSNWRQVLIFLSQVDRYRYARHYAIPAATMTAKLLEIDPDTTKIDDPRALAKRLYKGITVEFETMRTRRHSEFEDGDENEDEEMYFSGFNGFNDVTLQMSEITDVILDTDVEDGFSIADILDNHPDAAVSRRDGDTTVRIPWEEYLTDAQIESVDERTGEAVLKMLGQRREWITFTTREEAKAPLVDL